MQKPTTILSEEHQNILKVIQALNKKCQVLETGVDLDKDFFNQVINFIQNYADKFHHAKEEDILFKAINENEECMHCNPVEQMLHEHNLGRDFVKGAKKGLEENDIKKILENFTAYASLLQDHIFKEDNILYPMADQAISQTDQELMLEKFEQVEKEKFNSDVKQKQLSFVKRADSV
ncbi:MAG: hemerythrin domain-containing protein [Patescibacteria group bacterium]